MELPEIILRYATNGVIFDTNVLLLFLIGLWNPNQIPNHKRVDSYTIEDFELLVSVYKKSSRFVTTPHILTEICNLSDTINKKYKFQVYQALATIQSSSKERRQEATILMADPLYLQFGIADTSLIDASKKRHLIITDEAACYAAIVNSGGLVVNMNHLRSSKWL